MCDSNFWDQRLSGCLPKLDNCFTVHHIATKPSKQSLTDDVLKKSPEKDRLTNSSTHFLTLSYGGIHVFAIEIIVYAVNIPAESEGSQKQRVRPKTTIFVAKADSTGYLKSEQQDLKLDIGKVVSRILATFLEIYSVPNIPIRICLFARAQGQYIFPDSSKNPKKHVLTDKQLIKWWIKVLTPLLSSAFSTLHGAKLHIPGAELSDLKGYLIADSKETLWQEGDIFCSHDRKVELALDHIPNFPDDPKSRFLDFIEAEGRARTTTVDDFFTELQMRQEFLLGFVTAIIGVEGIAKSAAEALSAFPCPTIDAKAYARIHDSIVTSDYSTEAFAANATASFCQTLPELSVFSVNGTLQAIAKNTNSVVPPAQKVNVIGSTLIRKRSKPPSTETSSGNHKNLTNDDNKDQKDKKLKL